MSRAAFHAFSALGAPLAGLTPTWHVCVDAVSGSAITPQPAFVALGGGVYYFTLPASVDLTGIIDLGATAVPRYLHVTGETRGTVAGYNVGMNPVAGLAPSWNSCWDVDTGLAVVGTAFADLTLGVYRFALPGVASQHVAGVIDLGAVARPRYVGYDSDEQLRWRSAAQVTTVVVDSSDPIVLVCEH